MTGLSARNSERPRRRPQAGFTLIEVMVAILIMAIISVISWRGLDSITQASERLDGNAKASAGLLNALRQFERDMVLRADSELIAAPHRDAAGSPLLPQSVALRRQTRIPFELEILRSVPGRPGQWQRVQWRQQENTLYRNAGAGSNLFPLPAPSQQNEIAVLEGVQKVTLRTWRAGQGWQDPLASTQGRLQPEGLELAVTLREHQGDQTYRRVILLQ